MKILYLHRYDRSSASYRARCECYGEWLAKAGIEFECSGLFDETYLKTKYEKGRASLGSIVSAYGRRLSKILRARQFDLIIIHLELFPYFPSVFEKFLNWWGVPYIYDFDDPFYHKYDQNSSPLIRSLYRNKIKKIIRDSSGVIAGNSYLAQYALEEKKVAQIIPSVVDLRRYPKTRDWSRRSPFTIGWIGTPPTLECLKIGIPALQRFCANREVRLVLIGSGPFEIPGVKTEVRPWSEQTEVQDLLEFDVGIMPLPDEPFTRGKGGMKIIQYMACGIPAIASPVGFNAEIIQHDVNGLLATTTEEWVRSLEQIYENPNLKIKMGAAGRKTIEERYCLQITAPLFVSAVESALKTH